jgi:hypothetical protein
MTESLRIAGEASLHRQLGSEIYSQISPSRFDVTVGMLIGTSYQPSISFVSAFLTPDRTGQLYIEPLRWHFAI